MEVLGSCRLFLLLCDACLSMFCESSLKEREREFHKRETLFFLFQRERIESERSRLLFSFILTDSLVIR